MSVGICLTVLHCFVSVRMCVRERASGVRAEHPTIVIETLPQQMKNRPSPFIKTILVYNLQSGEKECEKVVEMSSSQHTHTQEERGESFWTQ